MTNSGRQMIIQSTLKRNIKKKTWAAKPVSFKSLLANLGQNFSLILISWYGEEDKDQEQAKPTHKCSFWTVKKYLGKHKFTFSQNTATASWKKPIWWTIFLLKLLSAKFLSIQSYFLLRYKEAWDSKLYYAFLLCSSLLAQLWPRLIKMESQDMTKLFLLIARFSQRQCTHTQL